jgi:hypothetical protein
MSGFQSAAVTMNFPSLRRFAQLLLALTRTRHHVQKNLMLPVSDDEVIERVAYCCSA